MYGSGTELTPKIDLSTNPTNNRYSSMSSSPNKTSQRDSSSNNASVAPDLETANSGGKNQAQPISDADGGSGFKKGSGIQIGSEVVWSPGKHGTYMSFLLLLAGMIASIVAMSYAGSITGNNFINDCPDGFEAACQRTGVVLRFSFALVIIVSF